jgi:uncharacterized protein with HEPN domain
MRDPRLVAELLDQILEAVRRIERRVEGIDTPSGFTQTDEGLDRLDGTAIMLVSIGEAVKRIEREGGSNLLARHPEIDWKAIKGMRDILSHRYFDVDVDVVFDVCRRHIPSLKAAVSDMREHIGS